MPEMEQQEFKFPDESEAVEDTSNEISIEIEDDTPPEDRGRDPMPKPLVEELEKDDLEKYDGEVKARLKQMRKVWHDERREKEAAQREQQEAINLARRLLDENQRIRGVLSSGEKVFVHTVQNAATLELEMAKKAYREAYESGDTDRVLEATQALQDANYKLKQAQNFKPTPLHQGENDVQIPQASQIPSVPKPDSKALAWQERNPWFGQDDEMTAAAYGLHEKLKKSGMAIGSDEYYSALDKTMRKRFPESFEEEEIEQPVRRQTQPKAATVVAPATRSTASNKVRLRQSQVQLAKKLGLTPEQYALAQMKLENQNG